MCADSLITIKDVFYLFLGLAVGLVLGIGIYWWPLGQLTNEWKAIFNLLRIRYVRDSRLTVIAGTDLIRIGVATYPNLILQDKIMAVWHDEGVGWFHTAHGWKRVRILQVFDPNSEEQSPPIYRICHLDIRN